jgi:AcrR family transcriptional regulator
MPLPRFERMPPEKRERLLIVAAQEFATHGFEAASLNRILEQAHVGKSSAYYYLEDKADLFCTVVRYCLNRLHLALDPDAIAVLTVETFWGAFAAAHERPLVQAQQSPWLFGALRAAERLTPESLQREPLAELVRDLTRYMSTNIGALLTRGQDLGLVRTDLPQELLIAWFRALDGAGDNWILARVERLDPATLARISQQTTAAIQRVLSPPTRL